MSKSLIALLAAFLFAFFSVARAAAPSDDFIYDQVRLKLATDQIVKGGALQVEVKQGVVTLGGQVEQKKQKDRATTLAKKVKGVKQVINNITLREQDAAR